MPDCATALESLSPEDRVVWSLATDALRAVHERREPGQVPSAREAIDRSPVTVARARERGGVAFDTPWAQADALAAALPDGRPSSWWGDPCVGVGRLVVAAWEHLTRAGLPPTELRQRLRCEDLDAQALGVARLAVRAAVAETAVALMPSDAGEASRLARTELDAPPWTAADALDAIEDDDEGAWIVTNPPFASIRAMHREYGRDYVQRLRALYPECRGAFDAGVPLVAACRRWSRGGVFAAVVPSSWRTADYADSLRTRLDADGTWRRLGTDLRPFSAAIDTMLVVRDGRAAEGTPFAWSGVDEFPTGCVRLDSLADVSSGTPGFSAQSVSDALVSHEVDGWPFVATGSLDAWTVHHRPVRLMGRTVDTPWLPRDTISSERRQLIYDEPKLLVPGVAKTLRAAADDRGCALSVGVLAVRTDEGTRPLVLACLNSLYLRDWVAHANPGARLSGGYARLSARMLKGLPIPDPQRADVRGTGWAGSVVDAELADALYRG